MRWAIVTGEYPPRQGGVSDYTRQIAKGLAGAGDEVHVWAPRALNGPLDPDPGVIVHALAGPFGPATLSQLSWELERLAKPYRLLVQYVPQAFGYKAMNVGFALWLYGRRQHGVHVMFHEVAVKFHRRQPLLVNALAAVTHLMASLVLRAADRVFMSTSTWEAHLRTLGPIRRKPLGLPIPSNIPTAVAPQDVQEARSRLGIPATRLVISSFGTYGRQLRPPLDDIVHGLLLGDENRVALLLGRGGDTYAADTCRRFPALRGRIFAPGALPGDQVALYLAGADLLVQPFPDGVTTRRTSLMAGLALGRPIVTTEGFNTESLWKQTGVVFLARPDTQDMIATAQLALADDRLRAAVGQRAAKLYREQFSLERTIEALRAS